jgi:hypothetical protein
MMPRRLNALSAMVLISTLLWGAIELLALLRSRINDSGFPRRSRS